MRCTKQEIIEYVREEDVKFIRLAFCDAFGKSKNVSIMPDELERAFKYGIAIDASAIEGFNDCIHSDLFLKPDPNTLAILPWRPEHGRVIKMFCSITYPDGRIYENDTRSLLIKAIEDAKKAGYSFNFGSELEFYLFKLDEDGKPSKEPYDNAGYMDIAPQDKGENARREICLTLEQMGIYPESSHHEEGPGQNEIDFRYSDALSAADNAISFATVVRTISSLNGLFADFSPLPIEGKPGNGYHVNISINAINNEIIKETEGYVIDSINDAAIAGILDKITEITAFLNPCKESYLRLGKNKAPKYISWSSENRSQLIRIPAAHNQYKRAELRSPDPSANPYVIFTLLIYAGLYGIENNLKLPKECNINLFSADKDTLSEYKKLPSTKADASDIAYHSDFVAKCLPKSVIKSYCTIQR